MNSLYSSSKHAAEQLSAVDTHLTQSLSTMDSMAGKLSNVETTQEQQLRLSHENLKGVQQLHVDSQQVHAKLAHALQNEVRLSCNFISYMSMLTTLCCAMTMSYG